MVMRDRTGESGDRNVWGERNLSEEMELERNLVIAASLPYLGRFLFCSGGLVAVEG